jgi:threonine/homoserine/homoserine lactone efflux protein
VGATAVLAASVAAYKIMTLAGAAYLVWMGVSMIARTLGRRSRKPTTTGEADAVAVRGGAWRGWATGLITNLLNPKVGVFYLATIPQFMASGVPPLVMGLLLASVHVLCGMLWCSGLVLGGAALGARLRSTTFVRWLDRVTGGVLVAFGAKLAWDAR